MGLPATHPDDGTSKLKPLPEGTNIDTKDLGSSKQLTDRDHTLTFITDQLRANTKYQSDADTMILTTFADIQALLVDSEDEFKDDNDEELLKLLKSLLKNLFHKNNSPHKEQPESTKDKKTDASYSNSSLCSETFNPYDNYMLINERNNDVALKNYERIFDRFKTDHAIGINKILNNLKEVQKCYEGGSCLEQKETLSHTKGEKDDMIIEESIEKEPVKDLKVEKVEKEPDKCLMTLNTFQ
uniref:Uncharacterized protein n=1 Tax=Tanacetum cinerariifolium TaxID=118510 RepID=A0A6L2KP95_TANCI|nr:hypothetical protein [Tanacetum cinerariifolium]